MPNARFLPCLLATCLLSGCFWKTPTVPVNLNYVESTNGYLNAGDFKSGSLFRWTRRPGVGEGRLEFIGNLNGFGVPVDDAQKKERYSEYVRGAAFKVGANVGLESGDIDAAVSKRARFKLTNVQREKSDDYITKIANHIAYDIGPDNKLDNPRSIQSKDNIMKAWRYRDAVKDPNQFFVLVTDVTYGDSILLEIDENVQAGARFKVPAAGGKVRVDLVGKDLNEISGTFTELMFRVDILSPVWRVNSEGGKNPDFDVVTGKVFPDMPKLLREMGKPTVYEVSRNAYWFD